MDELWDIARVAEYLGVTERTVYNKVRAGSLPAVKVGRLWRVRASDLEAWLSASASATPSGSASGASLVAEPGAIPPRSELERALAPLGDPLERRLTFVAILSAGVEALGWSAPVVVGGHAVEFYTAGNYTTVDIDLAGASEPVGQVLDSWGFEREGRHWFDESLGLIVEVPGGSMTPGEAAHCVVLRVGRRTARIIGVEDLIIDRLAACKFWRHLESCEWAARLIATGTEVDEEYLASRAIEEDVLDALAAAKKEASEQ